MKTRPRMDLTLSAVAVLGACGAVLQAQPLEICGRADTAGVDWHRDGGLALYVERAETSDTPSPVSRLGSLSHFVRPSWTLPAVELVSAFSQITQPRKLQPPPMRPALVVPAETWQPRVARHTEQEPAAVTSAGQPQPAPTGTATGPGPAFAPSSLVGTADEQPTPAAVPEPPLATETEPALGGSEVELPTVTGGHPDTGSSFRPIPHGSRATRPWSRLAGARTRQPLLRDWGGWLAWGWYDNSHGLGGPTGNSPLGMNNIASQLQVHQAWLFAEREADNGGSGLAWGYRADALFGTDGPDTQAFGDGGWDDSWDTSGQYGFAIPQLYADVVWNDWRVKVGHFYTIIGYEVVQAPDNFFYSRPYTMYYNEPFTHTGVLIENAINDHWTLYSGWSAGWDTGFTNFNDGSAFLGGVAWSPTDKLSFIYATSFGDPGDDPTFATDVYLHSFVIDFHFGDDWNYIFQNDFQTRRRDQEFAPLNAWKQYGINQYLIKQLGDRLAAGMRYEWFYVGEGKGLPLGPAALTPGLHYHALTFGLNYKTSWNSLVKPEIRYDWVDLDGAIAGGPFDRGTARSQFTFGLQSIWTF